MYQIIPDWRLLPMRLVLGWTPSHVDSWWHFTFHWLDVCYFFGIWVFQGFGKVLSISLSLRPFYPTILFLSYLVTATIFWLKLDSHPASNTLPIDMRELCDSPGKMWALLASTGSFYRACRHPLVDCSIWTCGCFTLIGDVGRSAITCGESAWK